MFQISVDIAAAVEDVWAVLVDVERWPRWTASMSEVTMLDSGPLAVGTRVRIKQPKLPPAVWQVTELEPRRGFAWKSPAPGATTIADHRLTPTSDDKTAVTLSVTRTGALAGLLDFLFRGVTRKYVSLEAEGLKRRCESAAG